MGNYYLAGTYAGLAVSYDVTGLVLRAVILRRTIMIL